MVIITDPFLMLTNARACSMLMLMLHVYTVSYPDAGYFLLKLMPVILHDARTCHDYDLLYYEHELYMYIYA